MVITQEHIAFIHQLADLSADVIAPYYGQPIAVDIKKDVSPVTLADTGAERAMRALIHQRFPHHGIWGEEYGSENLDAEFVWVLDPVDGTKSFMSGLLTFGTLIALLCNRRPVMGIINQPIVKDRWFGCSGQPTTHNGKTVRVRECGAVDQAILRSVEPREFRKTGDYEVFEQIAACTRYEDALWGGDCLNYGALASGFIDLIIEPTMKLHDFAPMVPIIEGAGGAISDWSGSALSMESDGHVIAAGSRVLLDRVVEALKPR